MCVRWLKNLIWRGLQVPSRLAFQRRLARTPFTLPVGRPVLNYGSLPQRRGAIVQGGKVKLLHLTGPFPEHADGFNLLYLISSAIPPHGLELARWAKARGAKLVWNQNGVGYAAWAGAEADVGRIIDPGCTNTDPDGPGWIGLHHPRLS